MANQNCDIIKRVAKIQKLSDKQQSILMDWVNPDIKYLVISCGRQVGKSYVAVYLAIKTCVKPSIIKNLNKNKCNVAYFMPFNDGARLQYERAKNLIAHLYPNSKFNSTNRTITFSNGSTLRFFGAENETSIRGNTFDFIIVDEACFVKDEVWQAAITPTISRAMSMGYGKVMLLSTPKEKNWFYDYFISSEIGFKSIKFTSYESGLPGDIIGEVEKQKKLLPKSIFENEYLAEFLEGSKGMFDLDRISFKNVEDCDKNGCVAGVDWGIENDYTVLAILNSKKEVCYLKRWKNIAWHLLIQHINEDLRKFGNPLVYCEKNGIGNMPTKELKRIYGATYDWITTAQSKTESINKLSKDLLTTVQDDKIHLPNIQFVKEEFGNFGFHYENGNMKFGNMKKDINDDTVMAIAIANINFKKFSLSF